TERTATDGAAGDAATVARLLQYQSVLDRDRIGEVTGLPPERVRAALATLGATGLVGYDVSELSYFHRELPFREPSSCTCRWWLMHGGSRGSCAHLLAAGLARQARDERSPASDIATEEPRRASVAAEEARRPAVAAEEPRDE